MLTKLCKFCNNRLQLYNPPYIEYSIFYIVFNIFPYLIWEHDRAGDSFFLKFIGGNLCAILLIKDAWVDECKEYFGLFWYGSLLFCLPFINVNILINNQFADWSLINTTSSIFILAALVDWLLFIILLISGTFLAVIYSIALGANNIRDIIFSEQGSWVIYIYISSATASFVFIRRRDNLNNIRFEVAGNIAGVLGHEVRTPLAMFALINQNFRAMLKKPYDSSVLKEVADKFDLTIKDMKFLVEDILIKLQHHNNITLQSLSIKSEIHSNIEHYNFERLEKKKLNLNLESDFYFIGDSRLFKYIIFNLIKNSMLYIKHKKDGKILMYTESENNNNSLIFEDNGIGIDSDDLPYIFNSFYTKRADGIGLGLYFCKKVIQKFGGDIQCQSQKGKYTRFKLTFPKINT